MILLMHEWRKTENTVISAHLRVEVMICVLPDALKLRY